MIQYTKMSKAITIKQIAKNAINKQNNKNKIIQKLVDSSRVEMLTLNEFVQEIKYDLDNYAYNKLYHSIKDDIPIYLDNELIQWMGFSGILKHQKEALFKLIEKYNISYIEFSNKVYTNFWSRNISTPQSQQNDTQNTNNNNNKNNELDTSLIYPDPKSFNVKATTTKHILIMPDDFKMIIMRLPTRRGEMICRYYITLEKLVKFYTEYQREFKAQESIRYQKLYERVDKNFIEMKQIHEETKQELLLTRETLDETNDRLDDLRDRLDTASDQRVLPTNNRKLREKFILLRLNDEDDTVFDYYVIRCQTRAIKKAIQKIREIYPEAERVLTITCQPNSKNLYNRIKEELADNIEVYKNYISPYNMSHNQFIRRIREINEERYDLIDEDE